MEPARQVAAMWKDAIAPIGISAFAAAAALGGFLIGRQPQPSFGEALRQVIDVEAYGSNFYEAIGQKISDPVKRAALAKIFDITDGALDDRLRAIPFSPPYRFAPFVGHTGRPVDAPGLHINAQGFRDIERNYAIKAPNSFRVFLTGGSSTWGSGSVQDDTIGAALERILNERIASRTGRRYEVVNAAFPAWSTTQEKILIQQRIVDMKPDLIIMISGTNDVHWTIFKRDIRWFFSYYDQNYLAIINEMHKSDGHPEHRSPDTELARSPDCGDLGRLTAQNVAESAFAARHAGARLIFVLQPNMNSTGKALTAHEKSYVPTQPHDIWAACYPAIREATGKLRASNYAMIDLSRMFSEFGADEELFIDTYHLTARANRMTAQAVFDQVDWSAPPAE